jgi:O-antigen ligase
MKDLTGRYDFVDIVNTYLRIALGYGVIGVAMYIAIFAKILFSMLKSIFIAGDKEGSFLAKTLFSITISFAIMIFTVSQASFLSFYNWVIFGLCAACINYFKAEKAI